MPNLVQAKLVEAFENAGSVGAVAVPGDGLVIDYQLIGDMRRFEIDLVGTPEAVVSMSIKLLSDKNGRVIQTRIFSSRAPVQGTEKDAFIDAVNEAFQAMASDVVRWVLAQV